MFSHIDAFSRNEIEFWVIFGKSFNQLNLIFATVRLFFVEHWFIGEQKFAQRAQTSEFIYFVNIWSNATSTLLEKSIGLL